MESLKAFRGEVAVQLMKLWLRGSNGPTYSSQRGNTSVTYPLLSPPCPSGPTGMPPPLGSLPCLPSLWLAVGWFLPMFSQF